MSRPLVYLVAVSRHPLLMDDPTARDVLVCMADLAQDRNGGRIVASVGSLAEACQRGSSAVRHARDRLIAAGFVVETGAGEVSKRAAEYRIREETLHAVCTKITLTPTPRKQRRIAATLLPSDCPDIAAALPSDCRDSAVTLPSTRARQEQERELEREQEPEKGQRGGRLGDPRETPDPAPAAWAMWQGFIAERFRSQVMPETERAIIDEVVRTFGLEHTQAAIASLVDARSRPPVSWVRDRAGKAQRQAGQHQAVRPQATPTHRRAGLPTAADRAAAQVDEAAEIARLEAEAAAQRARIEAVAPRPTDAPSRVALVEPIASPEKMRELGEAVRGLFGGKQ